MGARPRGAQDEVQRSPGLAFVAIGDRWNLLIIREAFRGARRFQDWTAALAISDSILAQRLRDLGAIGVLEGRPTESGRREYRLTATGRDMWQIFVAIWLWNWRWRTRASAVSPDDQHLRHMTCGFRTLPLLACSACRACGVTPYETSVRMDARYTYSELNPTRRYRRPQLRDEMNGLSGDLDAMDLLGDRWGTSVLSAALGGAHRFQEFMIAIDSLTPPQLTDRLNRFARGGVMMKRPVVNGKARMEYALTPRGVDFFSVLSNANAWAVRAFAPVYGPPSTITHLPCGEVFEPRYVCNACSGIVLRREVEFQPVGHP